MNSTFPKGKTAFLVIHGIGEQNPFETLDSFGRGIIAELQKEDRSFTLSHELVRRKSANGTEWIENFIRIKEDNADCVIDVHEFYWAYLTEERISVREVYTWVEKTLAATVKFYKENKNLNDKLNEKISEKLDEKLEAPPFIFPLRILSWFLLITMLLEPAGKLIAWTMRYILPFLGPVVDWLKKAAFAKIRQVIVGYIGDVAIYTTMDQKSSYFTIRQQILKESQALLDAILADDEQGNGGYDRVIVAGHSLGSVIAYDTLNRMNIDANTKPNHYRPFHKIIGLVTFGSPLDKVAFFFREYVEKKQYLRTQILRQLHSFKAKWARILDKQPLEKGHVRVSNQITNKFGSVLWINFHSKRDPISGRLDYYDVDLNEELKLSRLWGVAHIEYWENGEMYNEIIDKFL